MLAKNFQQNGLENPILATVGKKSMKNSTDKIVLNMIIKQVIINQKKRNNYGMRHTFEIGKKIEERKGVE